MKNFKSNLFVILLVVFILICGFMLGRIDFNFDVEDNNVDDEIINNDIVQENDGNKIETLTQVLSTKLGKFIVTKTGDVYFDFTSDTVILNDTKMLGEKGKYVIDDYNIDPVNSKGQMFEGYKLNLFNISSAYDVYFGNGIGYYTMFLDFDGNVNVLAMVPNGGSVDDKMLLDVKLEKNIEGYKNIVSVVENLDFGSSSVLLIDGKGTKYRYFYE